MQKSRVTTSEPDEHGHWGKFGGRYVPETLVAPLEELTNEFTRARHDNNFWRELNLLLRDYAGRPTPLFHAQRLSTHAGGAQIYLKREDLCHTGAHKINNALGQALLARRLGKRRIVAETGAGQHGVAAATVCARFELDCVVYMGSEDMARQAPNVERMRLLGAEGRLPDAVVACVGGGSNAIGLFAGFVDDAEVRLIGVEAAGAASLGTGRAGVLHGARSSLLADEDGQIADAHSISAGLDYPGVGPEHAFLRDSGRAEYLSATDEEALAAFRDLARTEGIIPALEPAHALARARDLDEKLILVCLSGRGDKDLEEVIGA